MISDLRLQHFRSYVDETFEFNQGVNIIVGPNASGKTNLLEAILLIARGGSYRAKDIDLIQFEKPWLRLDSDLSSGGKRTIKIISDTSLNKQYEIDGKVYRRLSLQHTLPIVLFEPNHLQLLSGGPERRRDYIDDLLEQTISGYGALRRQYKRTLAQRNAFLKQPGRKSQTQIFPWNVRLSQLAGQIVRYRCQLVDKMASNIPDLYKNISHTLTKTTVTYQHRWPLESYESKLLQELETKLDTDIMRGFTAAGPHREDLLISFDGHPAQEVASRGENRTLVLALKIIELQIIENARDQTPLLLLDDVFSELDGKRRHALTDYLAKYQTFITTTDADLVIQHFTEQANIIPLR